MKKISPYDYRQLHRMNMIIKNIKFKCLRISEEVGSLYYLLHSLETDDNDLKQNINEQISELEIINAYVLINFTETEIPQKIKEKLQPDVLNSASKLESLINKRIEEYLQEKDLSIQESAIAADSHWLICPLCHDAWESESLTAMVICPKCDNPLHNPRFATPKLPSEGKKA